MSFTCKGCGRQTETEIFISNSSWEIFKYITGGSGLFCRDCTIKLYEYIFGFDKDDETQTQIHPE